MLILVVFCRKQERGCDIPELVNLSNSVLEEDGDSIYSNRGGGRESD